MMPHLTMNRTWFLSLPAFQDAVNTLRMTEQPRGPAFSLLNGTHEIKNLMVFLWSAVRVLMSGSE